MEEIGIAELTVEQREELCEIAEKAARDHVLSKVPEKRIETLEITVDTEGSRPITVSVEVEIKLSPLLKNFDVDKLSKEAVEKAFAAINRYLGELACKSTE